MHKKAAEPPTSLRIGQFEDRIDDSGAGIRTVCCANPRKRSLPGTVRKFTDNSAAPHNKVGAPGQILSAGFAMRSSF